MNENNKQQSKKLNSEAKEFVPSIQQKADVSVLYTTYFLDFYTTSS